MLSQEGNPILKAIDNYKSWIKGNLETDKKIADNMLTWQMPHGGFYKWGIAVYEKPWNGSTKRSEDYLGKNGEELGTIDNYGTVNEVMFLTDVYKRSANTKYRDAVRKAFDFLLAMQYPSGGFPQVYPERGKTCEGWCPGEYANYVTFNDEAMARVLILLSKVMRKEAPLDGDLLTEVQLAGVEKAINQGVDFILKAQIIQDGKRTVWCAQHDPVTFAPRQGREFEHPSKSGSDSVLVIAFLMSRPQTPEIATAAKAALAWYRNPETYLVDTAYIKKGTGDDDSYNPIQKKIGSKMWFRFYDLDKNVGFFSGRAGTGPTNGKKYNIMEIDPGRRYGYVWGGTYGDRIIPYANSVGY